MTFVSSWSGPEMHYDIVEYLSTFLGLLGFCIKDSGYGNYEYWEPCYEGYDGGPGEYRWTFSALDDYYKPDANVTYVSDMRFVVPGAPTYVEFDYDKDGELIAYISTEKTNTSKHAGKVNYNEFTGKFEKSWKSKEQFEKEFELWFREESMRLLREEKE